MKVVILAGGKGTRLSEETTVRPKPLVEIGGRPILWHIMKIYARFGYREFIIALGYKGDAIRRYFAECRPWLRAADVDGGESDSVGPPCEPWTVELIDTGMETDTGGRLGRLRTLLQDKPFLLAFSDGLADINIPELIEFHRQEGRLVTVAAVHPPARFGVLTLHGPRALRFDEKPCHEDQWINGGFFVVEPGVFDYIAGDRTSWERDVLTQLAPEGQLAAYRHHGFWQCMDTLSEKHRLDQLWHSGKAPWKVWSD